MRSRHQEHLRHVPFCVELDRNEEDKQDQQNEAKGQEELEYTCTWVIADASPSRLRTTHKQITGDCRPHCSASFEGGQLPHQKLWCQGRRPSRRR